MLPLPNPITRATRVLYIVISAPLLLIVMISCFAGVRIGDITIAVISFGSAISLALLMYHAVYPQGADSEKYPTPFVLLTTASIATIMMGLLIIYDTLTHNSGSVGFVLGMIVLVVGAWAVVMAEYGRVLNSRSLSMEDAREELSSA